MTQAQKRELALLHDNGYVRHFLSYRNMPRNRPLWALVDAGLADFGFGPPNSFLQMQCFMPRWVDPVC